MYLKYTKRMLDITICILAMPVLGLLFVIVGLLIKFDDGGLVFFKADRIGQNGRLFKMYKFRSMQVNSPNWLNPDGSTYNAQDDPRVTKIGRFIREYSIDETAQIINVLKGDMSIIGPRASLAQDQSAFQDDEVDKLKVKPGITGYSQAYYRNSLSCRDKRLRDAWYANNVSFGLDVKILAKTITTVLRREGLYTNDGEAAPSKRIEIDR